MWLHKEFYVPSKCRAQTPPQDIYVSQNTKKRKEKRSDILLLEG